MGRGGNSSAPHGGTVKCLDDGKVTVLGAVGSRSGPVRRRRGRGKVHPAAAAAGVIGQTCARLLRLCAGRTVSQDCKFSQMSIIITSAVVQRSTVLLLSADGGVNGCFVARATRPVAVWELFILHVNCGLRY
jgi:hypothetical protein